MSEISFSQPVSSSEPRYGLGFGILIIVICLGSMVTLWGHYVLEGGFLDTDNYTRIAKLREFWYHGGWFDPVQHRVNPPLGHSTHWTKPLDIILLAGAGVLAPVLGLERALYYWGVIVAPLVYVGLAILAPWMCRPLLGMRRDWLATAIFATQWSILGGMTIARPDHNIVMLTCFMITVGCTFRVLCLSPNRNLAIVLGVATALGVWTSIEFILASALTLAVLGLAWLIRRERMAETGFLMMATATLGIAVAIVLEKGPGRLDEFTLDQISWPFLLVFFLLTLAWGILWLIERSDRLGHPLQRGLSAAAALAGALAVAWMVSPEIFAGPLSMVDPLYGITRLNKIVEYVPVINLHRYSWLTNIGRVIYALLYPSLTVCLALAALIRGDRHERWGLIYILIAAGTYLVLNFQAMHWGVYTAILSVPVFVRLGRDLLAMIEVRTSPIAGMASRVVLMVVLLFGSPVLGSILMTLGGVGADNVVYRICKYSAVLDTLNDPIGIGASPKRIVAFVDFNPELLYRTSHYVYSVPNHRPQPGYTQTYELMSEADMSAVPRRLGEMNAEYLLICNDKTEGAFYKVVSKARSFHDRLAEGETFSFLQPVSLPPEASQLRLYKIALPGS